MQLFQYTTSQRHYLEKVARPAKAALTSPAVRPTLPSRGLPTRGSGISLAEITL